MSSFTRDGDSLCSTATMFPLNTTNIVFFGIFFVEMILKQMAYGIKEYFRDGFNTFDALLVLVSAIDVALSVSGLKN